MRLLPNHLFLGVGDCYTTHYHIIAACPLSSTDNLHRDKTKKEG